MLPALRDAASRRCLPEREMNIVAFNKASGNLHHAIEVTGNDWA